MQFSLRSSVLAVLVTSLFSIPLFANGAEISLNSDAVRLEGDWSLGSNGIELETAVLHNEDRGNIFSVAAMKFGNAGSDGLNAGIGVKLAYIDPDIEPDFAILPVPAPEFDSPSGGALAIGGKAKYVLPQSNRINVGGYIWFAPSVLSFDKVDKYQEIGVYAAYNVLRDADVFIGYRNVKGGFKSFGDATIDTGLHFGLRAQF